MNKFKAIRPPLKLYSMIDDYVASNLLGIGDPSVAFINGRWTMFVGGFQLNFKNNIFQLQLPLGADIDSNKWQIVTYADTRKAVPLVPQPKKDEWDYHGLHTPSYVKGKVGSNAVERIYYAGRGSYKVVDNTKPYNIGVMTRQTNGDWQRHTVPILTGSPQSPNVLEPKAFYVKGKWRIYYTTTPQEAGKKGKVQYRIEYVESNDGVNDWSTPVTVFDEKEGFYDALVTPQSSKHYTLLLCRSTNLYGRQPFPEQGLWSGEGGEVFGARENWHIESTPLIRCDKKSPEWYRHGPFGPSFITTAETKNGVDACIFFSAVDSRRNWIKLAFGNVIKGRLPPPPAPFQFTIGRLDLKKVRN